MTLQHGDRQIPDPFWQESIRLTGRPAEADPIEAPDWFDWRVVRVMTTGTYEAAVTDRRARTTKRHQAATWSEAVAWVRMIVKKGWLS